MHVTELRVRYAETDTMGVVYHANYFVYFETARVEFLRAAGADYRALEAEGYLAPVVEARCRYHAPAHFDDLLRVHARLADVRRTRFTVTYRVERGGDGALIAEGHTGHLWLDARTRRPVPTPPRLRAWLAEHAAAGG
jgi:acyl-CoA thioester hydrolase